MENNVKVDHDICIGCRTCEAMYPELFQVDDNFKSNFVGKTDGLTEDQLVEMAQICPVRAIKVFQGENQIFPDNN